MSSPLAVMEMLLITKDVEKIEAWLGERTSHGPGNRPDELLRMLAENRAGCARVARIAADDEPLCDVADIAGMFDRNVEMSEEASVALYSLGNPAILEEGTREIVLWLEEWKLLGQGRDVLDFGCGIGRLETALAPRVQSVVGIDVSAKMVAVARRRSASLANVRVALGSGLELPAVDQSFDLVIAVDSMAYVVGLGPLMVGATFHEIARVLRRGGDLVIFEFSYREDLARDRADVAELAERTGFEILQNGSSPFALWNGRVFQLRRRGGPPVGQRPV
jgi:SAM-dependent methyltransferase